MHEVFGSWDERFEGVRDVLAENIASGADLGASVAIFIAGEPVLDVWGGCFDIERRRLWDRDDVTAVWSSSKNLTAMCVLLLADRGEIGLDEPVARYWPEFGRCGKEGVLVRHVLGHAAGLPTWDEEITFEDLYGWEKPVELLARQRPRWKPGTASGYHAYTQGSIIGEVVRRVTGRSLGRFLAEELAGPLGAPCYIGLAPEEHHRVSPVIPLDDMFSGRPVDHPLREIIGNPPMHQETHTIAWTPAWRQAELPAMGGIANARGLAAVQSLLANGGETLGVRLMSEAGCRRAFEEQTNGVDRTFLTPARWGMSWLLPSPELPLPAPRGAFFGGSGGSFCLIDPDRRMALAYVPNRMRETRSAMDPRRLSIVRATYAALAAADGDGRGDGGGMRQRLGSL
ncbi:serine hydrolase domain-containing protein [Streptomyces cucumeris]|uniref:serine hydrolase domain-containing protein n=1 Tax=Streptomyces cucumeris TaxID=2962890 RepID=UPI003D71C6AD